MKQFFLCLICSLLMACSDNSNNANVFEAQVESIDKAKEVEDKLLDAAQAQRQAIEANTE